MTDDNRRPVYRADQSQFLRRSIDRDYASSGVFRASAGDQKEVLLGSGLENVATLQCKRVPCNLKRLES